MTVPAATTAWRPFAGPHVARVRAWSRAEWPVLVILAAAVAIRLAVWITYTPALFFSDSHTYLSLAYDSSTVGIAVDRPSGYSVAIKLVALPGRSLEVLVGLQHLAGIVTGVLCYLLMRRSRVPRVVVYVVTAIILLDGFAIALEQHVMPEALFTLMVVGAGYLLLAYPEHLPAALASGALLSAAATVRTAALFALPVWLVYVVARYRTPGPVVACLIAAILPVALYAGGARASGHGGLTASGGWFQYGRVAEIADCSKRRLVPVEQRPLCQTAAERKGYGAGYYIWAPTSPAVREFGPLGGPRHAEANRVLGAFARATIRSQPGDYATMVSADVLRMFTPGKRSLGASDVAIALPRAGATAGGTPPYVATWFPNAHVGARPWAGALHDWWRVVHVPRWLVGAVSALAIVAFAACVIRPVRDRLRAGMDGFLLVGMGLAMVVGSVATSEFVIRYLVPSDPLILTGGALVLAAAVGSSAPVHDVWRGRGATGDVASARARGDRPAQAP